MKHATLVIPTYNEADNIEKHIHSIRAISDKTPDWLLDILVVDSTSPDGTSDVVKKLQKKDSHLHLLMTPKEGLGRAYMQGFNYALDKLHPEVLFEMDADFSHDPTAIPHFLQKIENGAEFVIGSRYIKGGSIPSDWALRRKLFSVLGNIIIRLGFMKIRITDWTSGYRAIRAQLVRSALPHVGQYTGYVFQIALLDHAIKNHAHIAEVPIKFTDRKYGVSKINSGQYIQNTLWYVFTHSSFVKYVIVGATGFVLDFGILYLLYKKAGFNISLAQAISAEVAIFSNFMFNNFWSFKHKKIDNTLRSFLKSFGKFNSVALGSLIIQTVAITIFHYYQGDQYIFLFKVVVLVTIIIPYSYYLYNRVVWKPTKSRNM